MLKGELIKVLFALEMAKNRLKHDEEARNAAFEARDIVFNELCEIHNDGRGIES